MSRTKYDLGNLKYFLKIKPAQSKIAIIISQRNYALDVLEEAGMLDCKHVDTTMDININLVLRQGEPLEDPSRY